MYKGKLKDGDLDQFSAEEIKLMEEICEKRRAEIAELYAIAAEMTAKKTLPCTACRYCLEYCPQGLNIPRLLEIYNEDLFSDGGFMAPMILSSFEADQKPDACIGCRSCENACPQQIKISEALADFAAKMARSE